MKFNKQQLDEISPQEAERLVDEVLGLGVEAVKRFAASLDAGSSIRFAHMCATRKPPGVKGGDRSFMEGQQAGQQLDQMSDVLRKIVLDRARKAGISISGKVWKPGLGKASDPLAWVSDSHDVKTACLKKGYTCEGAVTVDQPEREPPKPVKLSERLVRDQMRRYTEKNPDLAAQVKGNFKAQAELRNQIIEKHGNKQVQ